MSTATVPQPTSDTRPADQTDAVSASDMSGTTPDVPLPPPPAGAGPVEPEPRPRSGWHIVAIVVGCLALLPSLGLLTGGVSLAVANAAQDDGYFDMSIDRIESDGVAVAAVDLWDQTADDEDWPWALDWLDLDLRLRVDGAVDTDDVFVGIARTADVERYLDGAAFSEVVDLDRRIPDYVEHDGADEIAAPVDEAFWTVSAAGPGEQELTWEARGGNWSVVVMNADGSPAVDADVEVGVRSGAITPIAVVMIVLGGVGLTVATVLIVVGVRGRRR